MQCTNCQFENMPGTGACARCGTSLRLKAQAIGVHPPRASTRAKVMRQWFPVRRAYYRLRDDVVAPLATAGRNLLQPVSPDSLTPDLTVRLPIPGWAQWYLGNRARGGLILGVYLPLLLYGLVTFGSTGGAICLGFAVAVHAASWIDLLGVDAGLFQRVIVAPLVTVGIFVALYLGIGAVVGRFASPRC